MTETIIACLRQPAPEKGQIKKNRLFGGDKTDTPTDMLHKEAQVAFKILMTH